MHIQVNTDHNIEGPEKLADHVRGVVEHALSRFSRQITRVEVHLSAQAGDKSGHDDKRCMMEVRIEGRQPTAVAHQAASVDAAINGAAEKMEKSVESALERLHDHH